MSNFFKDHWLGIFLSLVAAGLVSAYLYNLLSIGDLLELDVLELKSGQEHAAQPARLPNSPAQESSHVQAPLVGRDSEASGSKVSGLRGWLPRPVTRDSPSDCEETSEAAVIITLRDGTCVGMDRLEPSNQFYRETSEGGLDVRGIRKITILSMEASEGWFQNGVVKVEFRRGLVLIALVRADHPWKVSGENFPTAFSGYTPEGKLVVRTTNVRSIEFK